ncbi:hypothetical protein GALMADRAFT_136918 [Galerina marginata CBS 339.88]|uniref:F-box domain-containing protein n=1 Tax=Galerina marginata (strain CBS 339.88) TaxID=685588 RepID=A0A067TB76_GALM3|nr:hypothetical protein GALMADRAFT_136918 [Galerina marginata CBS 339.88]
MAQNQGITILSLIDDLLLTIFSFNTDMTKPGKPDRKGTMTFDDICLTDTNPDRSNEMAYFLPLAHRTKLQALTTTLRTSQVCHLWRDLLLMSSSVWGRLLDFDILLYAKDQLWREIYRRAGDGSRLSVQGFNIPYPSKICDFVFNLIATQWARLEWVDVYIKTSVKLSVQQSPFWSTIATPALNLRHFSFIFSIPTANPQMLTHAAPALREVCTTPSSPLHLNSPWLRQLTYLSIDGVGEPIVPFTFPAILDALSSLLNLETLRLIYTRFAEGDYSTHRNVQLPNLRKVVFEDYFNTCFAALRHISPSQQCMVEIRTTSPHELPNIQYFRLMEWLEQYLNGRRYNDRLMIDLQPTYVSFVDAYPDCYPTPTVNIRFSCPAQNNGPDAMSFFSRLSRTKLDHVKSLWFRLNIPNLYEELGDFLPVSDNFYYGLESLEVLKISAQGFLLLDMASSSIAEDDERPVPLPHLQRVRMISPSDEHDKYDQDTELGPQFVEQFLDLFKRRTKRKCPITHLDVRECAVDLRRLDICKGLKVTWRRAEVRASGEPGEYICGSGNRKILNIED